MYDQAIQLYEKAPLFGTGLVMGIVLVLLHLWPLLCPVSAMAALRAAAKADKAGQALMGLDCLWIALLLWNSPSNPFRMPLFEFEGVRGILLICCPVVWFVFASMGKRNLFPRALGLFLLLMAIVPLSAAYLKDPVTRLLIPIWWYPVLTISMFWVAWPWQFRDEVAWLTSRPRLFRVLALLGTLYGAAIVLCALLFW